MATTIPYSISRSALYHPELDPTIFVAGTVPEKPLICAELSRIVYKKFESDPAAKQELRAAVQKIGVADADTAFFDKADSQAIAIFIPARSYRIVAFRGTEQNPTDFATDIATWSTSWRMGGKVHAGFAKAFDNIWPEIEAWTNKRSGPITWTGHSLGAALATLAASVKNNSELVTFGSPRVGDEDFAKGLQTVASQRYVDCCDIVCQIPPHQLGFHHVSDAIYIDRDGTVRPGFSENNIAKDQQAARLEYLVHHSWKLGSIEVRDLADHTPLNYVRAFAR